MKRGGEEERRYHGRRRLLLSFWILAGVLLVARAGQVQVVQGEQWRQLADGQHQASNEIPAPRGRILDRDEVPLAESREAFRVSVAPTNLERDRAGGLAAGPLLREVLGLDARELRRITDPDRKWIVVPGRFPTVVREALAGVSGVYVEPELRRANPHGDLAIGPLGRVLDGVGTGGIEQQYDTVLRGIPGRAVLAKDSRGRPIPGETWVLDQPVPGGEVVLTLDLELQEIAHEALQAAIEKTSARGGDILVSDPGTGEILAMVSLRDGEAASLSAINAPYEPGSTLKPFTVAAILSRDIAALEDSVEIGDGQWTVAGRTIRDVHPKASRLTLADALRVSSNVGVARMAAGLSAGEQYENLRDFGFGIPTGIELPGEASGILRRPSRWSGQSPVSLAIGYEISVTPIQMAMAYGSLANGGELMAPLLVKEVRGRDGRVIERSEPTVVRRVVPEWVTREINQVLVDVVEDGTGTAARMASFKVAGKSGTSRAHGPNGYVPGNYFASFIGFFPADDPQLVIFVKLENPRGSYYGGATAAPVTRAALEGILAARRPPLDRRALVEASRRPVASATRPVARFASLPAGPPSPDPVPVAPGSVASGDGVVVPDVRKLPARIAVRRLHALGFRVIWESPGGRILETVPAAGSRLAPGDTVRIVSREVRSG